MVDFGGWDMPVQYSGIIEEHLTVRKAVGLFDVSHMGEIEIRGPKAAELTNYVTHQQCLQAENWAKCTIPVSSIRTADSWDERAGAQGGGRSLFPVRERFQPG